MKNRLDRNPCNTSSDFFWKIAIRPIRLLIFLLIFVDFASWVPMAPESQNRPRIAPESFQNRFRIATESPQNHRIDPESLRIATESLQNRCRIVSESLQNRSGILESVQNRYRIVSESQDRPRIAPESLQNTRYPNQDKEWGIALQNRCRYSYRCRCPLAVAGPAWSL